MKTEKYDFKWFKKEDLRKLPRASLRRDGKLALGKNLRERLPPRIRIGFDAKSHVLAIADGHGSGIDWPKCGTLNAGVLCAQILAEGLKLPIVFRFERDEATGFYLGKIEPQRRLRSGADGAAPAYDMEQLLALYQPLIDNAVYRIGKSTPLAERRAYALEAFCEAVRAYRPGCGDMEEYLEAYLHKKLVHENKQYTTTYLDKSLDAPMGRAGDETFCLYDVVQDASSGGISQIEERIMAEQFLDSLSTQEQTLLRLMEAGCLVSQIALELGIGEEEVIALGRSIGKKRQAFYSVA